MARLIRSSLIICLLLAALTVLPSETSAQSSQSRTIHTKTTGKTSSKASRHSPLAAKSTKSKGRSATGHHSKGAAVSSRNKTSTRVVVKRAGKGRHSHAIVRNGSHWTSVAHHQHAETKEDGQNKVPEPLAENVQDASNLSHVYRLYDEGLNARLSGRYEEATKKLLEASNTYTSTKSGLTMEAMIDYELGQAAEANHNYSVAADAYTRCLRIKPRMVEASVRLSSMLMTAGETKAALSRARETVADNPDDPRAHELLALVLAKTGDGDDAKSERHRATSLLHAKPGINPASQPPGSPVPSDKELDQGSDKESDKGSKGSQDKEKENEMQDSDVTPPTSHPTADSDVMEKP